jgi:hypothetical protein
LYEYGKDYAIGVVLSCAGLADCDPDQNLPEPVANSIAIRIPMYFTKVAKVLAKLLRNSEVLKELRLISTDTDVLDLIEICNSIRKSSVLSEFEVTDVAIGDENIKRITNELSRTTLKLLVLRHCGLTNASVPILISYVENIRQRFRENGLREIDLSDNAIESAEFEKVISALSAPLPTEPTSSQRKCDRNALIEENRRLKAEIARLKGLIQEVVDHNALFIVGEGAPALVKRMKEIEARISALEH